MSVGRPSIDRVLETFPDRPLTRREVEVLEAIEGPFVFSTYATLITPQAVWHEYGMFIIGPSTAYAVVFDESDGWHVLERDADPSVVTEALHSWIADEIERRDDVLDAVEFSSEGVVP